MIPLCAADTIRGVSKSDIDIVSKVKERKRPVIICMNKDDCVRNDADRDEVYEQAAKGFKEPRGSLITCAFDPLPQLLEGVKQRKAEGEAKLRDRLLDVLKKENPNLHTERLFVDGMTS